MRFLIYSLLFTLCSWPAFADAGAFDMERWNNIMDDIRTRAAAEEISNDTVDAVMQNAVFIPGVVHRDKNQSEFKLTMDEYLRRTVNATRIKEGRATRTKYPTLLRRTHETYGIPPHVILAFWGLESNYGKFKTQYKISDAYLTLIYNGRREKFFTEQLMALMKVADRGRMSIDSLRGSWAGAMGHFQFIPTTLLQYAVDGNNDGRIDIINSESDAMFSAGNYLKKLGWETDGRIVRAVAIPANFDVSLCDAKTKRTHAEWAMAGVVTIDYSYLPGGGAPVGIVCESNTESVELDEIGRMPAYLTYDNFYRIKKWNNSNVYAVAIALLADALKQ